MLAGVVDCEEADVAAGRGVYLGAAGFGAAAAATAARRMLEEKFLELGRATARHDCVNAGRVEQASTERAILGIVDDMADVMRLWNLAVAHVY